MVYTDIDLTFPMVQHGIGETPWDLNPLLYRGGASIRANRVKLQIDSGELGSPSPERVALVVRLHEHISDDLVAGGSRISAHNKIFALRQFFAWCDVKAMPLSIQTVTNSFVLWSDYLLQCHRVDRSISAGALYDRSRLVATLLDRVLDRKASLSKSTRIRKPRNKEKIRTSSTDKYSVQNTFAFGHFLTDVCNALSWEACVGSLPVSIALRTGQIIQHWSGLPDPKKLAERCVKPRTSSQIEESRAARSAYEADKTPRTRYPLINLRIECEMLIFIAQTGVNLKQAHTLRIDQFHYTSHLDGYQVRNYKKRRDGEVLFEIFATYRKWFEHYLEWRDKWFHNESGGLLFPLIRNRGRMVEEAPQFTNLLRICRRMEMPFVRPRMLRGVRINWLLRESQNPQQVAELAQHSMETLIRVYANPHPQIAMIEISRFHRQNDPSLSPPAPGRCLTAKPTPIGNIPLVAPRPDCINAAGCLFCAQHRDIESQDHVWSLGSLRHLKSVELARYRPSGPPIDAHPTLLVIERLTAKLHFFEQSGTVRKLWVEEVRARVNEGYFHPAWDGFIRLVEIGKKSTW